MAQHMCVSRSIKLTRTGSHVYLTTMSLMLFPADGTPPQVVSGFCECGNNSRDVDLLARTQVQVGGRPRTAFMHVYFLDPADVSQYPLNPYYNNGRVRGNVYVSVDLEAEDGDALWPRRARIEELFEPQIVHETLERHVSGERKSAMDCSHNTTLIKTNSSRKNVDRVKSYAPSGTSL